MKTKKFMELPILEFKYDESTGKFSCYVNTKHNIDHAGDRPQNGCYQKSIAKHLSNGTMPKMLWSHDKHALPVGTWHTMKEDDKGLYMEGELAPTAMGKDIKILAERKALDSFSIGYYEIESSWNTGKGCNDLFELDIQEASWVNFACDEKATLQGIKTHLEDGEIPSKRELQRHLQATGLSRSEASKIVDNYNPKEKGLNLEEIGAELKKLSLFN